MNPRRFLVLLVLLLLPAVARAESQLLTPDAVDASSQQVGRPPGNLINGSGIVGYNGQTEVALDSVHQDSLDLAWAASPNDPMPRIYYVWEIPQEVCGLVLWQAVGAVGVKDFIVTAFDPEGNALGAWTFIAMEVEPVAGVARDIPPQFFPIGSEDNPLAGVASIVLDVRSNYGADFVALSETHFAKPSDEPREGEFCVVDKESFVRWHVPLDEKDQSLWYLPQFNEASWNRGPACLGYETGPLCKDLIVYLTMDSVRINGFTVEDTSFSPVEHDGIRVGDVPIVAGRILQGLSFPGDQQNFVRILHDDPTDDELDPGTGDYSVGVWVFPQDGQSPIGVIAQKRLGNGGGWTMAANAQNSGISLYTTSGEQRDILMPGLPANQWSHLAFVIDRAGLKATGYLNGIPETSVPILASDEFTTGPDRAADILLLNTPVISDNTYRAVLDEFAVWRRAVPQEEMDLLYRAGVEGQGLKAAGTADGLYANLIETNVGGEMFGINSSIWERIPFSLNSLQGIHKMTLRMHYDDGFVCYLNGVEVARRNAPSVASPLPFNAASAGPRPDNLALTQEEINLDAFINLLQAGTNVLAIHGLNERRDAERFVIWPELCLERKDCRGRNDGRDFWITFPENFPGEPSNPKEISVCITGIAGTNGRVEMPRLGVSIPFTVAATGRVKVFLSPFLAELSGTDVIEDKGVHITAERPVSVVGLNHINFSTDGFLALPTGMLGHDHLVLAYPNVWDGLPQLNGTEFGIVATADGTKVQIIPSVDTAGRPAGVPYYLDLDQGQTYQLYNTEKGDGDLSGTVIRATEPIGLFAGHRCANVRGDEFFCDQVIEHIPAINHWRSLYFVGPLATRSGGDTVRVIAARDGTQVFFNGALEAVLNRGEVHETIVATPTQINSTGGPVLVAQFSNSSDFDGVEDADPFMALVPPPDAWATAYRICAAPTSGFDKNFLNITILGAAVGATTVDGVALPAIPGATFTPIGATGLFHVTVPISASPPHDVFGPSPFGVIVYGFASYNFDSYGYPGGISFRDIPPNVSTAPQTTVYATTNGTAAVPDYSNYTRVDDNCDPPGTLTATQVPRASTALEPGTYLVSVSATDSSQLTGTTTSLLVVLPPWQQAHFPDEYGNPETEATIWGWDADPDGDGDSNKKEMQFGGDPNDFSSRPVSEGIPAELRSGTGLRLRFRRRLDDPFVTYLAQGSQDATLWQSGPGVTAELSSEIVYPGGEFEDVLVEALATTASPVPERYFLRVMADGCPP